MSEVKRWTHHVTWDGELKIQATMMALRNNGEYVLASDYDALAAECERLRLDNLSKNGSMKAFGEQIAALQRAVKNRDKLKARAEAERDAALAELAALKGGQEAVSKLQWPEIVGLVNEVLGCEAHKFPCSRGSIGHEMTGINFNSLARIIDRVRHSYPAPPAQASAWPEGWKLVPVEPTEAIRDAINLLCDDHSAFDDSDAFWSYLLDAAPTPGASDGTGGEHE